MAEKIANVSFRCHCNPHQGVHGNIFHSPFNFANILGVQVSQFCQLLLSQTRLFPVEADGLSQWFAMTQKFVWHGLKG